VTVKRFACSALLLAGLLTAAADAAAQTSVTSADIQRLQDSIYDASRDVAQARGRDTALASQLQAELDDARDEAIYLKVKLRKNEPITRSDYADLRDRIEDIRSRARGDSAGRYSTAPAAAAAPGTAAPASGPPPAPRASARPGEVPVGTELDVRLQNRLTSDTAQVEDRFEATTVVDLMEGDRVLVPAGSVLRGVVSSVTRAGRLERKGSMTLAFDQITVGSRTYPIRATVTEALESEGVRGEAARIGTGAGVGAIIGGILGGFKGALAGILIGGGGTIAATEGKDVELPAGTVLRVRLDQPLGVERTRN
jgi:hypothetical protein